MTQLAKGCVMLMCPDLPIHLNTTTWALHLNPPARGLRSNKQTVSSFVMGFKYAARYRTMCVLEALKANCSWWEICLSGAEVTNLGKFGDRYGS